MPVTLRRRILPVAIVLSTTLAVSTPAFAATPEEAAPTAASWLADQLTDAGTVVGSFPGSDGNPSVYTDYGRSLDAALALLAAGGHDDGVGRALTTLTSSDAVAGYTQGAPFDRDDAAYAGATAKLAFFVEATGGDATAVADVDLLAQLQSLVTDSGRLADRSDFGSFANLYGHAFALLALDTAGRAPDDAFLQALLAAQCADGSFPQEYEPKEGETCAGQVDATGLVLQALAAVDLGSSEAAQRAVTWLTGVQKADGSFPGEAPVNSTGYAALGLDAAGATAAVAEARDWLTTQQNADGGLRRGAGEDAASDLFATAQALPALAGRTFQESVRSVAAQAISCGTGATVVLPEATITATGQATVQVRAASGTVVDLFAYSRPSTDFGKVRTATVGADGQAAFSVRPPTNTRLYAQQRDCAQGESVVLNVRTALSLQVVRNGERDYTFSGDSLPARAGGLIVSLYRLTPDGRAVLTSQARADARTGDWSVRRVFTGAGRFGFVVRTGQDLQNAPGSSNVRSLLVF
jgi:hypothetical protein